MRLIRSQRSKLMEDRNLPIYIQAFGKYGKITRVSPRTRCTRIYSVEWADGTREHYKGAATRPYWVRKIFRNQTAWRIAQVKKETTTE